MVSSKGDSKVLVVRSNYFNSSPRYNRHILDLINLNRNLMCFFLIIQILVRVHTSHTEHSRPLLSRTSFLERKHFQNTLQPGEYNRFQIIDCTFEGIRQYWRKTRRIRRILATHPPMDCVLCLYEVQSPLLFLPNFG
jgi:hypothetical protein